MSTNLTDTSNELETDPLADHTPPEVPEMGDNVIEGDLELEVIPVNLKRPNDPNPWACELREMNGFARDIYMNKEKAMKNPNGVGFKDFKNVQATLINMTLWDLETQKPVPLAAIGAFPSKLQIKLYAAACKINGFDQESEAKAKNS